MSLFNIGSINKSTARIMEQRAAEEIGRVSTIPTTTDTTIPMRRGRYSVAVLTKVPSQYMIRAMKGLTKWAAATPTNTVTAGVTRISTFVFFETSIPISTATITAKNAPAGPAAALNSSPSAPIFSTSTPMEYPANPTAAEEKITRGWAFSASATATPMAIPEDWEA